MKISNGTKEQIKIYIKLLNKTLFNNPRDYEYKNWIPNCIEVLEFAINTDREIPERPYNDLLSTLYLLYKCFVKSEEWAYIELSQKFRTVYSGEQIGRAFKVCIDRMKEANEEDETKRPDYVSFYR